MPIPLGEDVLYELYKNLNKFSIEKIPLNLPPEEFYILYIIILLALVFCI